MDIQPQAAGSDKSADISISTEKADEVVSDASSEQGLKIQVIPPAPPLPPAITETQARTDTRTGWIYLLRKGELITQMQKFNLDTTGTVEELRRRLVQFIREGRATPLPSPNPPEFLSVNLPMVSSTTPSSTTSETHLEVEQTNKSIYTACLLPTTPLELSEGPRPKPSTSVSLPKTLLSESPRHFFPTTNQYEPSLSMTLPGLQQAHNIGPGTFVTTTSNPGIPNVPTMTRILGVSSPYLVPQVNNTGLRNVSTSPEKPLAFQPNLISPVHHSPQVNNPTPLKPHKWNIHFDGTHDPVTFLERLEEICVAENILPDRLLPHIPDLLQGEAALWFRNNKHNWTRWTEFRTAFRDFYFPVNYEVELEAEIARRRQRRGEPISRYITELQTLIRRHGNMNAQTELNWLYRNLLPDYRQYIRRTDFHDTASFTKVAREYEILQAEVLEAQQPSPTYNSRPPIPRMNRTELGGQPRPATGPPSSPHLPRGPSNPTVSNANPMNYPTTGIRNSEITCWRCGQTGHLRGTCPNPRKLFCSRCGKTGVLSRNCPCPKTQGN